MNWPYGYLQFVLCIATVGVFLPWLIPRTWRNAVTVYLIAVLASVSWISYEMHLQSLAKPGDPLIRVDLFAIVPLVAIDWLSATASMAFKHVRRGSIDRIASK